MKHDWHGNRGFAFKGRSFGKKYNLWVEMNMRDSSHMRIGRFAVIVSGVNLIAAPVYVDADSLLGDPTYQRGHTHYEATRRDRLRQIAAIEDALLPDHIHYAGIRADIDKEKNWFGA